jgi:hypothetical protein
MELAVQAVQAAVQLLTTKKAVAVVLVAMLVQAVQAQLTLVLPLMEVLALAVAVAVVRLEEVIFLLVMAVE